MYSLYKNIRKSDNIVPAPWGNFLKMEGGLLKGVRTLKRGGAQAIATSRFQIAKFAVVSDNIVSLET